MFKKILVVVDDQPTTQTAVQQGVGLARNHAIEVVFLYILPNYTFPMVDVPVMPALAAMSELSADQFIEQAKEKASAVLQAAATHAESVGVQSKRLMGSCTDAAEYVVQTANQSECGLIVVASEGRNAVMRLLTGSIVPALITKSCVPVMVCPHEDTGTSGVDPVPVKPQNQ